ncbi:SMODS domain-containing nucleotidyltransferase [Maricaulis sp.]|uniref:SMODS domain-containing nucleotidyltransferase n=1 Tax=Maricaulis sp. TaxID=1486257 RepID=UPI003A8DD44E
MTINAYLQDLSANAVLSNAENEAIARSIDAIGNRLNQHFGGKLDAHFRFGSSTRGTILPRMYDEASDIDYMVVFADGGYQPQTYLNQLRRFVHVHYARSTTKQTAPTITLSLHHIRFDLVPATREFWGGYQIPAGQDDWICTNPNDFNADLTEADESNRHLVKPAIRLAKIWNARSGYVLNSYLFEKWIAGGSFWFCTDLRGYFFSIFDRLEPIERAEWKNNAIRRAKRIIQLARARERAGSFSLAQKAISKLFA